MKKNILVSALCILALAGMATASARLSSLVTLVGQDDGNTRVGVTASCTNSTWTAVVAVRENRRLLKVKASDSNTGIVCLGTDDAGGTCVSGQYGYELGTGDEYSDSNEGKVYCRSANSNTQIVKGFDEYDSNDVR